VNSAQALSPTQEIAVSTRRSTDRQFAGDFTKLAGKLIGMFEVGFANDSCLPMRTTAIMAGRIRISAKNVMTLTPKLISRSAADAA